MNGLEAVTAELPRRPDLRRARTPQIGFEGPMIYQLGNSGHYDSYYRDVLCGNTASPSSGPDGDAAQVGWDAATGFGAAGLVPASRPATRSRSARRT